MTSGDFDGDGAWDLVTASKKALPSTCGPPSDQRSRLLEEIVQLDELFETGRLAPADYQHLRNSKKAGLAMLGNQTHRSS